MGIYLMMLRPLEPVFQGKPLSIWLKYYDDVGANLHPNEVLHRQADEAVRNMGTKAIPFLIQRVHANDSSVKFRLLQTTHEQHIIDLPPYTLAWTLNVEAMKGFEALGAAASNAVPELMKIYIESTSEQSHCCVAMSLGGIGPPASNAVPLLLHSVGREKGLDQRGAIWALGQIHAQSGTVVPVLATLLTNKNPDQRFFAANALGHFGSDAKIAVPFLMDYFKELPDGVQKSNLVNIFWRINSNANSTAF